MCLAAKSFSRATLLWLIDGEMNNRRQNNTHIKGSKFRITRSPSASLLFKGLGSKYPTVKWTSLLEHWVGQSTNMKLKNKEGNNFFRIRYIASLFRRKNILKTLLCWRIQDTGRQRQRKCHLKSTLRSFTLHHNNLSPIIWEKWKMGESYCSWIL